MTALYVQQAQVTHSFRLAPAARLPLWLSEGCGETETRLKGSTLKR